MATVKKKELVVAGSLSADQRKYLYTALVFLLAEHPVLHVPAVGAWEVVRTALAAGYKPEDIYCSDVSLPASLVGNLIDPTSEKVEYELSVANRERWETVSEKLGEDDLTRAAFVFWCMKRAEFASEERFADLLDHLDENTVAQVEQLKMKLEKQVKELAGVRYRIATLPAVLSEERTEEEAVVVVPPVYVGKEVKGFKYGDEITFDPHVEPYTYRREFGDWFNNARTSPAPHLWAHAKGLEGFDEYDVMYAKEQRPDRVDYLLTSHPEVFDGHKRFIQTYKRGDYTPYPAPIWGPRDVLTKDTKITFVKVDQSTLFYYRDLWAHKLGATAGDGYLLMIADGKVLAAVIMQLSAFNGLKTQYIFEQSGFNAPSELYPQLNRLLMWCLTCREFGDFVCKMNHRNRFYDAVGLETTCLSKYRKMKGNNGILEVKYRERLPKTGMYRILYRADFREEKFSDCIQRMFADHGLDENGHAVEES